MRERPTIEPRFFETYHYAGVIRTMVDDPFGHIALWSDFFCDGQVTGLVSPYTRDSAFHAFIRFVIDHLLHDYMAEVDLDKHRALARIAGDIPEAIKDLEPFTLPVERALKAHGIGFESFVVWLQSQGKDFTAADDNDVYDYFEDLCLCQPYEDLLEKFAREVFFILFADREVLLGFNMMVAQHMQELEEHPPEEELLEGVVQYFERPGILKRAYMPEWVRRAVFFRDRGRCVKCRADLTGLVSLWSEDNFDHMVALAANGLNDITNIQLLCALCNQRKGDGASFTSSEYEDWYPMAESIAQRLPTIPLGSSNRSGVAAMDDIEGGSSKAQLSKSQSSKARSSNARSPKARSPKARSPKAQSPKARSPKARLPKSR